MYSASQVKRKSIGQSVLLVMALVATHSLSAQDILGGAPPETRMPLVLRDQESPPPLSQPPAPPDTPYKIGPIVFHPSLNYGYSNVDGLPTAGGARVASEIHTLSVNVSADLGQRWSLSYSPTWMKYTEQTLADSFDQSASVSGIVAFQDWGFQVSESYSQSTPTLIETGQQTKQETWASSLGTSYSFNPNVQMQASVGMNERYTDIAPDTRSWSSSASINLTLSERLSLNLGASYNYNEITAAPDTYSENFNAGLNWQPTEKLSLGLNTGMQYSHSNASTGQDLSNPVLNFSLSYQPFATTSLSFTAARTVSPSYFLNQVTESLQWSIGLNQRLFGRVYLNASYAPHDTDYVATDALTPAGRNDSVDTYSIGASTQLFRRLSVSFSFSQTDNQSNFSGFSFSSRRYGVQLGYRY